MALNCGLRYIVSGLAVLASLGAVQARGNLLVNGQFSTDPVGTTMATGVTGWTWESLNGGGSPSFSFTRNDAYSNSGRTYLWLNDVPGPEPTAYQDVTITSGAPIELTGNYHNIVFNPGSFSLAILFYDASVTTPTLLETNTFATTSNSPTAPWASFDLVRTFNTTDLRVAFVSQYGSDADTGLDNLSLVQTTSTAVPEPSTIVSGVIAGLMGIGYASRRRSATPV